MINTYAVGWDHGNSESKAAIWLNGKDHIIQFPSATDDAKLDKLVKARSATGSDILTKYDALGPEEYILEYKGNKTYVGKLALEHGEHPSTGRGSMSRYSDQRNLECLLTAAATLIPDTEFGILVVTGLPWMAFEETIKRDIRTTLNHTDTPCEFVLNGKRRKAYIKVGKVLLEGAGATLLHEVEADQMRGVIDIGGYSTDLYAARGLAAQDTYCDGINIGIEAARTELWSWFSQSYGFPPSEHNKQRIISAYLGKTNYPELMVDRKPISPLILRHNTEEIFRKVGKRITDFIRIHWQRGESSRNVAGDFDSVEVIGGGAHYYLNSIQEVVPLAVVPSEPEHANVRGYTWFARQLLAQRGVSQQRASA